MTLLELCEPLFQYVCRLKRLDRSGHTLETQRVRSEIVKIFEQMAGQAPEDPRLAVQYEKVELALVFFVDFMVKECQSGLTSPWHEIAVEKYNEFAGDEKFFVLLDDTLNESGGEADARLAVFYTCLGLGFTGIYLGQPDVIRKLMRRVGIRIAGLMDSDERGRVCPEAYEGVDTRNLIQPPGVKLTGIVVALICLIILWIGGYAILYRQVGQSINDGKNSILRLNERAAGTN